MQVWKFHLKDFKSEVEMPCRAQLYERMSRVLQSDPTLLEGLE